MYKCYIMFSSKKKKKKRLYYVTLNTITELNKNQFISFLRTGQA